MIKHYMTRYFDDDHNEIYVSWLQIFGIDFSKRYYKNGKFVKNI
ncbi:hypothetical protein OIT44_03800 [Weissella ceti]|uniref:Uncharacterized protein n=1 Tax=Weissella ceti TaxID=759620 RepID=A0ABT3E5L4_9LACO|nr:hypothetical protein [Weissella ceti]MCW0953197.1 hypothetical protein [Weissella ceti]